MTAIPDNTFNELLNLTAGLEKAWLFVKFALKVRLERETATIYKVWATCPYCGEESLYRENIPNPDKPFMLGTGCVKCNRRVKVEVRDS